MAPPHTDLRERRAIEDMLNSKVSLQHFNLPKLQYHVFRFVSLSSHL